MPCGTLAEISTSVVKAGDAVVQTQLIERATTPHVTAAMDQFGMAAVHLSSTADALTGTANAATATLSEGQRTIAAAQPVLRQLTVDGAALETATNSFNDRITALAPIETHLAGMSASGDKMLADAQWKTHQLLHPDKVKLSGWGATWVGVKAIHSLEPPLF